MSTQPPRHFLDIWRLDGGTLRAIVEDACRDPAEHQDGRDREKRRQARLTEGEGNGAAQRVQGERPGIGVAAILLLVEQYSR